MKDWLVLLIIFLIFGLVGSFIIDLDHLNPILENPKPITHYFSNNFTEYDFWDVCKGKNCRSMHLILFVSTIIIFFFVLAELIFKKGDYVGKGDW